jgi:hypothetical protein
VWRRVPIEVNTPSRVSPDALDADLGSDRRVLRDPCALADQHSPADTAEWAKHTKGEVDQWRVAFFSLSFLALFVVGNSLWGLRNLPLNWSVLFPYLTSRSVLSIPLMAAMLAAHRKHGRAAALLAAGVFGDARTISSAIAAQGAYRRNLVLQSSQTTEDIAGCRATFEAREQARETRVSRRVPPKD